MHSELANFINSKVSGAGAVFEEREVGDHVIFVDPAHIFDVSKTLRDEKDFKVLQVITGTDYLDDKTIEVSYILATFDPQNSEDDLILKVKLDRENPELDSVVDVWKSADYQERECYDMLGVNFRNHPNLIRILCCYDWEGFPLRKDYEAAKEYKGMTIYPESKNNSADQEFKKLSKADPGIERPRW
ncbi:MAG: NADH-quinone oxidoreductase subunit C [Bacteriovoracaceae bacterium]|jgi:NADH-quinone oxidoreductase subunit C|nr:NADH-quinone oxidoreductase subunit C [Bacteriovoracaceae bacterium]